jgi:heme/copper-type cytochrome/quinol oxidase subunit 1
LSFLFMFSINVLRSVSGLSVMVLSFLLLVIGIYCSTNSGGKPDISWVTYPPAPFPWGIGEGKGVR